ncbi:hypothetical protein GALL_255380 [mine drainage metagenome]|uniref:Uncharacterized protein n=1 Tax=mine drainage metagenome TaxID=410659 RepID=A0A1J5RKP9_9ZZZZ
MRGLGRMLMIMMTAVSLAACSLAGPPSAAPRAAVPPPPPRRPPPPVVPRPAPVPSSSPDQLLGLDEAGVAALLGRPGLTQARDMGRLWRYRRGHCVLALIFYPEVEGGALRVASYDFEHGRRKSCWRRLRAAGGRHVR